MAQIPLHSIADAGRKICGRPPANFRFDLAHINGVATVMPRSILDKGYLVRIATRISWAKLIKDNDIRLD